MTVFLFLIVLERMLEFLIPGMIAIMALRRLIACPGFDRVYYGYVLIYCIVAIWFLPPHGAQGLEAHILRYMAFSTLPLWFLVLYETEGSARPYRKRADPPARRHTPLRLEDPLAPEDPEFRSSRDDALA